MMQEKDFAFSLYPNDLVHIKSQKGISAITNTGYKIKPTDAYVYYKSSNVRTASIVVEAHDGGYTAEGIGIQNLDSFEKYQVDVLGNKKLVKGEKRKMF